MVFVEDPPGWPGFCGEGKGKLASDQYERKLAEKRKEEETERREKTKKVEQNRENRRKKGGRGRIVE